MKVARLIIVASALAAACAEAGGESRGGDITDAGTQATTPGEFVSAEASVATECGEGTTWSSLYRDLFGPTGKPGSCTFQGTCHGSPDAAGSKAGILCVDEAGCRLSMIDKNLATPEDQAAPEAAQINFLIRNRNPKTGKNRGIMPKSPSDYVFPEACMERIRGWIVKGVPAD